MYANSFAQPAPLGAGVIACRGAMLINRVSRQLLSASELEPLLHEFGAGHDVTLAVAQSARPLMLAALWAENPRPCLLLVSGEEAADRTARALAAWLGMDAVSRYPERKDRPGQTRLPMMP